MSMRKRINVESLEQATEEIRKLDERLEALEKIVKLIYHKQNTINRSAGAAMQDVSINLTNAHRKISQVSKK